MVMKKTLMISLLVAGAALVAAGADAKALYTKDCAKCHGADGKGDTKMGQRLGAKDYTDAKFQATLKDEHMAKVIKEGLKEDGRTKMRPVKDLTDEEIKGLVAYMRAFVKK
jgi:mono/diheme cytochrome c family protein